jgi:hypothetical protein
LSFEEFLEQSKQALLIVPQLNTLGETGFSDISYTHNPTEFALFVQNTLEIDELIINLGLRYDWFNPDHQSLTDPRVNPAIGSVSLLSATTLEEVEVQSQFSPRIGIAYPIIRQIGNTSSYLQRTNIDNATNQGFTVALEKLYDGGIFTGGIDYTYQVGKGNESDPDNIAIIQTAGSSGGTVKDAQKEFIPLDWNQTHTLNATLAMNLSLEIWA